MTKWEYCQVVWMQRVLSPTEKESLENEGFDGEIRQEEGKSWFTAQLGYVAFMGSDKVRTTTDINDTIAQLGLDGWEMLSHSEVTTPAQLETFFFKRHVTSEEGG